MNVPSHELDNANKNEQKLLNENDVFLISKQIKWIFNLLFKKIYLRNTYTFKY